MTTRKDRLRKLVIVQEKLKALHETRHAGFIAHAQASAEEAAAIVERFDAPGSLSVLFPEVYNRRIENALAAQERNLTMAKVEAGLVATATARTNMVERAYREVRLQDERDSADRERLEMIERKGATERK